MRISFVHYPGRLARLAEARSGDAPTEFLFGAVELERAGHVVRHFEVDPRAPAGRVARRLVDRSAGLGHLPPHASAAVLRGTRALLPELRDADVVVATTTGTAVALAAWRRAGRLRVPLVGIVAGLLNRPWRASRRVTTLPLLRAMHAVLYGPGELPGLLALEPALRDRVHVNAFGVDTAFWHPLDDAEPDIVLSIGNDGHRDWTTLLAAAPGIAARVRILTGHARPDVLPPNVTWEEADWHRRVLTDGEVREAYAAASVVVVPVKDVPQPSGQSVTLQALACSRPVVLSETRGLWDAGLLDRDALRLVPAGDSEALAAAVRELLADPAAARTMGGRGREHVLANATVEDYARRLEAVCETAIRRP